MHRSNLGKALLAGACILAGTTAWSQQSTKATGASAFSTDVAASFDLERAKSTPNPTGFWLKGGGLDAAITFNNGLGVAAAVTSDHGTNGYGVDTDKVTFLGGPRYTKTLAQTNQPRYQFFAQGLVGGVHGFNGIFPSSSGVQSSANSYALQAGGGVNILFHRNWGIRLFEADYVRTALPNNAANEQNDFRLSFGVTFHR
jgi:hypothetical protein